MKSTSVSKKKEEEEMENKCRRCIWTNPITNICTKTRKPEQKNTCKLFKSRQTSSRTLITPELLQSAILHPSDKTRIEKDALNRINMSRKRLFKIDCDSEGFEKTFSRLVQFSSHQEHKKNDPDKSILKILENIGLRDQHKKGNKTRPIGEDFPSA